MGVHFLPNFTIARANALMQYHWRLSIAILFVVHISIP